MQLRLSLGSAFKTKKALSPTNYQLPMRGRLGRQWSVLAIDLPAMLQLHVDPPKGQQPPSFASLRGLTFCSHLKVRGAFTSDNAYTPETLPREMSFSTAAKTKWTDTCVAASPRAMQILQDVHSFAFLQTQKIQCTMFVKQIDCF